MTPETNRSSNIVETSIDASQSQSPAGNQPEPETLGCIPEPEQVDQQNGTSTQVWSSSETAESLWRVDR